MRASGNGHYAYDAAGNMTNDGFHSYTYDADGNITQVDGGSTANYSYDAFNQRVRIAQGSTATEYVFNLSGKRVSTWDGTSHAQLQGQYYWGSTPIAFYQGGSLHFQHQDWEGTERVLTSYNGTVEGSYSSLPWGDGYSASGADPDAYHFAQLDHDTGSNTEHAQFRQLSATQGRWLSPDPYSGSYDLANPQSFNRYAYVGNRPLSSTDSLGLFATVECNSFPYNVDGENSGVQTECFVFDDGGGGDEGILALQPLPQPPTDDGTGTVWTPPNRPLPSQPAPNNGKQEPPPPCRAKILNATNNQFGKNFTDANVSSTFNYSTGAGPGQGTLNLNITGSMAGVSPGYYPVHWWTYAIGYGSTLHVVGGPGGHGGLDSQQTLPFGPNQGTLHINSGYAYNPVGVFFHWFLNMTKVGGYPKC